MKNILLTLTLLSTLFTASANEPFSIEELLNFTGEYELISGDSICQSSLTITQGPLDSAPERIYVGLTAFHATNSSDPFVIGKMSKWKKHKVLFGLNFRFRNGYFRTPYGYTHVYDFQTLNFAGLLKGDLMRTLTFFGEINGDLHYSQISTVNEKLYRKENCRYKLIKKD